MLVFALMGPTEPKLRELPGVLPARSEGFLLLNLLIKDINYIKTSL